MLAGIGGQGIQLAAAVLARAAVLEDRFVLSLGTYGGTMRGGNTEATVVVGDAPLESPPIVSRVWAALVLHDRYWEPVRARLRPGSQLWSDPAHGATPPAGVAALPLPAEQIAHSAGAPLAVSLVMLAAFCRATGLVALDALREALRLALPERRARHLPANLAALDAGAAAAPTGAPAAWAAREAVA